MFLFHILGALGILHAIIFGICFRPGATSNDTIKKYLEERWYRAYRISGLCMLGFMAFGPACILGIMMIMAWVRSLFL